MRTALRRLLLSVLTAIAALPLLFNPAVPATPLPKPEPNRRPEKLVVEVVGRDFRWHFRHMEPAGTTVRVDNTTGLETLHLPAGATVELRFTSEDYIYLCSVPGLGVEQIAVPGLVNVSVCEDVELATYELLVDPLCSFRFYHDERMGRIVIREESR